MKMLFKNGNKKLAFLTKENMDSAKQPCKVGPERSIRSFISAIDYSYLCRAIDDSDLYTLKFNSIGPYQIEQPNRPA